MKHGRADYDRFQDPAGLIPADEPVFLFRAQDKHAAAALRYYADLVWADGGDMEFVRLTREQAQRFQAWPKKKQPDVPAQ